MAANGIKKERPFPRALLSSGYYRRRFRFAKQHARLACRWSKDRGKEPAMTGAAPAGRGSSAAPSCAAPASGCFWSGLATVRQGRLSRHRQVQGWSSVLTRARAIGATFVGSTIPSEPKGGLDGGF